MSTPVPPPPPGVYPPPPPPSAGGEPLPARLWTIFRGLPMWAQVLAWVFLLPFVGALLIASTPDASRFRYGVAVAVLVVGAAVYVSAGDDGAAEAELAAAAEAAEAEAAAEVERAVAAEAEAAERAAAAAEAEAAAAAEAESEAEEEEAAAAVAAATWTVHNIVDGDTVDVRHADGGQERVRLVGIDTPERGDCGFGEAASALAALVLDEEVQLVAGAQDDRDRYDRILRYVDVDGVDAGLALIEDALAIARYDSRDGYGRHDREAEYVAADQATDDTCTAPAPAPAPRPAPAPAPEPEPEPEAPSAVFYENCDAARAAGAAPVLRGDPGYAEHLDGDDDGIGCE